MQDRQLLRIAPIGLDPLAWLAWNHRRRGDGTLVSQTGELAINPVPAAARFITEVKLTVPCKLLRHLGQGFRRVRNHADEPNRTAPPVFCNANGNGRFVNVHADK